ncbi:uncharacterized protein LOC131236902 isoform X2 [Magnolia sinica]|uniref:uncharacterized protein LOC131236902 isoform X2 n=1 Tax=Magnolia sinica TaxID=86752 RepID=UPI002657C371|nr:uncharacterized protein LOC131236902 isoform X2 [Magnolia sinica]
MCTIAQKSDMTGHYTQSTAMDKAANVILDIESLAQSLDKCSGSPKLTRALSRKGSCRIDRKIPEEQETEEASKKLVVKVVSSQLEPLISNKPLVLVTSSSNSTGLSDGSDGKSKRFNRFITVHPKEILLIFATLSSMGTLILIYFTLSVNRTGGP